MTKADLINQIVAQTGIEKPTVSIAVEILVSYNLININEDY